MVGVLRPKPDARAVVQPEPTALGLLDGTFSPSRRHIRSTRLTFTIQPAWCKHRRDATITIAAILESECRDVGGQCRFVIR